MIRLFIVLIALIITALWISSPSEADIQACMDSSNLSRETCLFTLKS